MKNVLLRSVLWMSLLLASWAARGAELDLRADLPVDPKLKQGKLENGMSYWIRRNATPPGRVGFWLRFGSGSLNETDEQRGLAHYLEHMAFNGSKNFAPGTLVKYFESLGLRFGGDQNAFTSFDQTAYQLYLPDTQLATIQKGLLFLSDVAFRMSLLPEEIERERSVILEEDRARKGAQQRLVEKEYPLLLPGSRVPERLPIGKAEVIKGLQAAQFLSYYRKWYHPADTTLFAVGDIEPAVLEKAIGEAFNDWKAEGPAPADLDPAIKPYEKIRAAVVSDPELAETEVSLNLILPLREVRTVADYRAELVRGVSGWIMNRRFSELVQRGKAPFRSAYTQASSFLNTCTLASAGASGKPENWSQMLYALALELKRAHTHGFLDQELEDARKALLAEAEQAVRREGTRDSTDFLRQMNGLFSQRRKPLSAEQRLDLLRQLLAGLTAKELGASFSADFDSKTPLILVEMPEKPEFKQPSAEEILAQAALAGAAQVEALVARDRPKSLLEQIPAPGSVESQEEDQELNIRTLRFRNGVCVHLRSMDTRKDQVLVQLTLAGGEIQETAANRGATSAASAAFDQPASARSTSIDIRDLFTGINARVSGGAGRDALSLRISASARDLENGFQLAYLLLTGARLEPSALDLWRQRQLQAIVERKSSLHENLFDGFRCLLYGEDVRIRPLAEEQVKRVTLESAQAWLDELLRTAPLEAAIVGDLPLEQAATLAGRYLGSLPVRPKIGGAFDHLRKMNFKKEAQIKEVAVDTITLRAEVALGFRGAQARNVEDDRAVRLAARVLEGRLRDEIREKRALTYSIGCQAAPSEIYDDCGYLLAFFTADPGKVAEASRLTHDVMRRFASEGPTWAEIQTVRRQVESELKKQQQDPGYWLRILGDLDYRQRKLKDVKEELQVLTTLPVKKLRSRVAKYLVDERYFQAIALPKQKAGEPAAKKQEEAAAQRN